MKSVLDEVQAGIKIARRNTNNLRYVADVTLMAESEEELNSLLIRVKEESEKTDLKLNIQKIKIMASCPITSWQIEGKGGRNDKFSFLGLQNGCGKWLCHEIKRCLLLGRKVMINLSSVQFSRSVVSNSLWPHRLQHNRPPCPLPTPGVYTNSCPLSRWCHPTISSSVIPFSCLQSFPASGSFLMSQFFASGGQSIGVSASASVLPMSIQDWFPLGWTGCISLQSKGLSRVFSNTTVQKHQFFGTQLSI